MRTLITVISFLFTFTYSATSFAGSTNTQLSDTQPTVKSVSRNSLNQNVEKGVRKASSNSLIKAPNKEYIVQFNDDALITKSRLLSSSKKNKHTSISSSTTEKTLTSHKQLLAQKRNSFISTLKTKNSNAKMMREYDSLLNGMAISTDLAITDIKKMDNVKAVYPVQRYKTKLSNSLPIIKASESWVLLADDASIDEEINAGKSMRIAIIDSGIINDHIMFDDTGMTAPSALELESDDYCRDVDVSFCNNKIIVARHYLPSFIDLSDSGEYDSPLALSGHGTHVAGIAAGRIVTDTESGESFSGVAPGAYIMAYKALWGQDGEGTDIELLAAMNDAVADGADVINNSWGSSSGADPVSSLYKDLYEELEASGVIIVSAAGNEGSEGSASISCPGCIEAGITVGATSTGLSSALPITFDSQTIHGQEGSNSVISTDITANISLAPSTNSLGCDAWDADSLMGYIIVVTRGTCTFASKAELAQDAGAIAMVVINNEAGSNVTMLMDDSTLPSVLVSPTDGELLVETITDLSDTAVTIGSILEITVDSASQDWVADFSSLGPNGDDSFIKPDLAAPGIAILSATSAEDESSEGLEYTRLSGTSMASPTVAGAAALLKQYAPELTPLQIKSILVNSADAVSKNSTGERDATAFETGAGRLNILNALQATTYAVTPNMVAQPCTPDCSVSNQLTTLADTSSTWNANVTFDNENVTGSISPSELTLSSINKSDTFTLNINAPLSLEEDWYFGRVQWTNSAGEIINQAVAISNQTNTTELLQLSTTDNGTTQSVTLVSNNISGAEAIELGFTLTGDSTFVDNSLTVTGGDSHEVTTELEQDITVAASVSTGTTAGGISIESAPINVNLEDEGIEAIECDIESSDLDGCDEVLFGIYFDFEHFGQDYDLFYISENGFVVAGDDIADESALYYNLAFPNEDTPDNIIAPFWSDFDLINPNLSGDTGGGEMFVASYEQDGIQYLVIQWNKAKLYTDSDVTPETLGISNADIEFTFQLILQTDSDNKWFRYIDIPEQPNYYSVGMENSTGTQGYTHWFDGDGVSQVSSGDELFAQSGELGSITLNVDVEAGFTQDDTAEVVQGKSVTITILDNDTVLTENGILTTSVNDISQSIELFLAATELTQSSLTIESQPENGEAVVNNGAIEYTPDSGFTGSDQFTYSVADDLGQESSATVTIEVEPKKEDEGFLGLSLGIYLQSLLIMLMLLRRAIRRTSF